MGFDRQRGSLLCEERPGKLSPLLLGCICPERNLTCMAVPGAHPGPQVLILVTYVDRILIGSVLPLNKIPRFELRSHLVLVYL